MKKLILHVGTHKTGTTTIQRALYAARGDLAANGILYDTGPVQPNGVRYAHHWVAHALARDTDSDRRALRAFRDQLLDAPGQSVVISAEPFYRQTDKSADSAQGPGSYGAARAAYLVRVKDYFAPFDTDVSIYFRRPDSFATSLYKENAASNAMKFDFDAFLENRAPIFDYQARLAEFEALFGPARVFCFESAAKPDLVASFFAAHGLGAPPAREAATSVRSGISERAALWMVTLKQRQTLNRQAIYRRWSFALSDAGRALFDSPHKEMFWPSAQAQMAFAQTALEGFAHADFWALSPSPAAPVAWDAAQQQAADRAYATWERRNHAWLRTREALGAKPYAPDADLPPIKARALQAAYCALAVIGRGRNG